VTHAPEVPEGPEGPARKAEPDIVGQAVAAGQQIAGAVRDAAEEALMALLEFLAEAVPRFLNRVLALFALAGVALLAIGGLVILDTPLFLRILSVIAGLALIALGVGMFLLAWKLHEATATLRTLARLARGALERRRARG
jgi:sulfite exporter TauE/SafE